MNFSDNARAKARASRALKADALAASLVKVVADMRAKGFITLVSMAAELNCRGIPCARGGQWSAMQMKRLLERIARIEVQR